VGRAQRAFTLLEMIVAMGLMVIVSATLYGSLSAVFQGRRVTEEAHEPLRRASGALELLTRDIGSATPPAGVLAGEFVGADTTGDSGDPADTLAFHCRARRPELLSPMTPIVWIEFALTTPEAEDPVENDELVLVRRTITNLLAPEAQTPVEEVLCRRVRALDFSYFDGTDWVESWNAGSTGDVLPLAVATTLTIADERGEDYSLTRTTSIPCGALAGSAGGTSTTARGLGGR